MAEKRSFVQRLRRGLTILAAVAVVGAVLYGASWLNSRRYFLIVGSSDVRVAKGRMLPFGHEPYVPSNPKLRRAYRPLPLPAAMALPRGTTTFDDRSELDQALRKILDDAAEVAVESDDGRAPGLLDTYLERLELLPGASTQQQLEFKRLERDAAYVKGRAQLKSARKALTEAKASFDAARSGTGSRFADAEQRARQARRALDALGSDAPSPDALEAEPRTPTQSSTTATSTEASFSPSSRPL